MTALRALNPVLTRAGMRAIFARSDDGLSAKITHVGFGDRRYAPTGAETALGRQRARIPVASSRYVSDHVIELVTLLDHGEAFEVAEMGVFLDDGTLLAVWSDADTPLAWFQPGVPIAVSYVLGVSALPPGALAVTGDLDLTLFFGVEFARLAGGVFAAFKQTRALEDRVAELDRRLAILDAQQARVARLEAGLVDLAVRQEHLLGLIARVGALALRAATPR